MDNENDELSTYQLNTVTTAVTYLAIQCISQLAMDNKELFQLLPIQINQTIILMTLTGSDDITELQTRCKEISSILKSCNIILRQLIPNNRSILENIDFSGTSNAILSIEESETFKTLGVQWISKQNIIKYNILQLKCGIPLQ